MNVPVLRPASSAIPHLPPDQQWPSAVALGDGVVGGTPGPDRQHAVPPPQSRPKRTEQTSDCK